MLTKKQLAEIKDIVENTKSMSAKQLLVVLKKQYTRANDAEDVFGNLRESVRAGVTVIDPKQDQITDQTRISEIKKGAKVRTKGESAMGDDLYKNKK